VCAVVFFYWVRKLVGVVFLASAAVVAYMLVTTLEFGLVLSVLVCVALAAFLLFEKKPE
jgi:hypothetical protein